MRPVRDLMRGMRILAQFGRKLPFDRVVYAALIVRFAPLYVLNAMRIRATEHKQGNERHDRKLVYGAAYPANYLHIRSFVHKSG
jgi:hypothetical protein